MHSKDGSPNIEHNRKRLKKNKLEGVKSRILLSATLSIYNIHINLKIIMINSLNHSKK